MRRILVDPNVLLDVLLDRPPYVEASAALWAVVERGRVEGYVAAHGVTTLFYLIAKAKGRRVARSAITALLSVFRVAPVDEAVLLRAAALDLPDFEDAVAAAAAEAAACDAIVTRDADSFVGAPVEPLDPLLALAALADDGPAPQDEVHEPRAAYARGAIR